MLGISCDATNMGVFCDVNEVAFGESPGNLRMGAGCLESPPGDLRCGTFSDLWGEERGWRLNQLLMTKDLSIMLV